MLPGHNIVSTVIVKFAVERTYSATVAWSGVTSTSPDVTSSHAARSLSEEGVSVPSAYRNP